MQAARAYLGFGLCEWPNRPRENDFDKLGRDFDLRAIGLDINKE